MESRTVTVVDDDVEVVDTDVEGSDAFAAYFAEANKPCDREVSSLFGIGIVQPIIQPMFSNINKVITVE